MRPVAFWCYFGSEVLPLLLPPLLLLLLAADATPTPLPLHYSATIVGP